LQFHPLQHRFRRKKETGIGIREIRIGGEIDNDKIEKVGNEVLAEVGTRGEMTGKTLLEMGTKRNPAL
jgi:hypothetical protein